MAYSEERYLSEWKFLQEKGLNVRDLMRVRKAFGEWGVENMQEVEFIGKFNCYTSTISGLKGYSFDTAEEVKLLNALHKFAPDIKPDKLVQVFSMVLKLVDSKSEWSFKGK